MPVERSDDEPIDVTRNLLEDAGGRDPDSHSPLLRQYHRQLWSRPLPSGHTLELDEKLRLRSGDEDWWLASDAITNSYLSWSQPAWFAKVRSDIDPDLVRGLFDAGCTVGAYIVFPYARRQEDGKYPWSINQARGMRRQVRDRMDLTLECIRRHFRGEDSPLAPTLTNVEGFFALFDDFNEYVQHFLLDGLVDNDGKVRYLTDHVDLAGDGLPRSADEYRTYIARTMDFIKSRNEAIVAVSSSKS